MNGAVFESGQETQLLEYLQTQGMTVVIWNEMEAAESGSSDRKKKTPSEVAANRGNRLQMQIASDLVGMGFRRGQVGFNNIVIAIYLISKMGYGRQIRVTHDVYPKVAKYYGTSVSSVERTIRNAIESVWKRSNLDALRCRYPFPCDNMNGRPTNAEFLINTAMRYRK